MVTHGGLGYHMTEIYARFGQDTATFFFKVRTLLRIIRFGCTAS